MIGTGAGGAPLLSRLAAAGLRVVALEAGGNRTPEQFTADEVAAADLYWPGERLSGGATPEAFGANNSGIGVGGSTLHWGAFVPRPNDVDLRLRTQFGLGEDWPFALAELLPLFAGGRVVHRCVWAEFLSVGTWSGAIRCPRLLLNAPAQLMQAGCDALGRATLRGTSRDRLSPLRPDRHP